MLTIPVQISLIGEELELELQDDHINSEVDKGLKNWDCNEGGNDIETADDDVPEPGIK